MSTRRKSIRTVILQVLLTAVILVVALAGASFMMVNRVTPDRAPVEEHIEPVEVLEVRRTTEPVVVMANGTVTAAQQIQLRPEVSGRVVELAEALVPGGRFQAGETIAKIDERDYRVRVTAQTEVLASARLMLRQEQARKAVAEEEWQLLDGSIPDTKENRDLALRIPQIEQAEAAVEAARGALDKARLDLERCTIVAPFDATIIRENVDLGQVVSPQTEVATLVGTDTYWVQVSLPIEHLQWIDVPAGLAAGGGSRAHGAKARIIHRAGELRIERQGRVDRLLGDVDQAGRLARLLIVIDDPLNIKRTHGASTIPLLIGSYVTVEILGHELESIVAIPRQALREVGAPGEEGTIEGFWVMSQEDRLESRTAQVVWRAQDTVFIDRGIDEGERIVTSPISTPVEGMHLRVVSPEALEADAEHQGRPGDAEAGETA